MGTYLGLPPDRFQVETDEGNIINVILCDSKGRDVGTQGMKDGETWFHPKTNNKCVVEFYSERIG